jgi:hypothetical protein
MFLSMGFLIVEFAVVETNHSLLAETFYDLKGAVLDSN